MEKDDLHKESMIQEERKRILMIMERITGQAKKQATVLCL